MVPSNNKTLMKESGDEEVNPGKCKWVFQLSNKLTRAALFVTFAGECSHGCGCGALRLAEETAFGLARHWHKAKALDNGAMQLRGLLQQHNDNMKTTETGWDKVEQEQQGQRAAAVGQGCSSESYAGLFSGVAAAKTIGVSCLISLNTLDKLRENNAR